MKNGFNFFEKINIYLFYKNGDEERFLGIYDFSINGYFITILNESGCNVIKTKDISSIHIFKPNKEFDQVFNLK